MPASMPKTTVLQVANEIDLSSGKHRAEGRSRFPRAGTMWRKEVDFCSAIQTYPITSDCKRTASVQHCGECPYSDSIWLRMEQLPKYMPRKWRDWIGEETGYVVVSTTAEEDIYRRLPFHSMDDLDSVQIARVRPNYFLESSARLLCFDHLRR